MLRRGLLICSNVSSLLCVASDLFAGIQYEGYDFIFQAVNELFVIDAPTSYLVVPLFTLFEVLLVHSLAVSGCPLTKIICCILCN
jgi:hypothetical protein